MEAGGRRHALGNERGMYTQGCDGEGARVNRGAMKMVRKLRGYSPSSVGKDEEAARVSPISSITSSPAKRARLGCVISGCRGLSFGSPFGLLQHAAEVHGGHQKCLMCGAMMGSLAAISTHLRVVHATLLPPRACPVCAGWCSGEKGLRRHLSIAHREYVEEAEEEGEAEEAEAGVDDATETTSVSDPFFIAKVISKQASFNACMTTGELKRKISKASKASLFPRKTGACRTLTFQSEFV